MHHEERKRQEPATSSTHGAITSPPHLDNPKRRPKGPRKPHWKPVGGPKTPLKIDRQAIKTLSLAGMPDKELTRSFRHKGLTQEALRQWRSRDPEWKEAFRLLHKKRDDEEKNRHASVTQTIENSLPAIGQRNSIRIAVAADAALEKFTGKDGKRAPKPKNWTEAATVYKTLRTATGQDAETPQIQMNIWGQPGLQQTQPSATFRDLPTIPAPEAPAALPPPIDSQADGD